MILIKLQITYFIYFMYLYILFFSNRLIAQYDNENNSVEKYINLKGIN